MPRGVPVGGGDLTALLHSSTALLLFQIAVILVVSRAFGTVFRRIGQPLVVAEIFAGIALGPSLLGVVSPAALQGLFPTESLAGLGAVSQLGLIFFMFVVGLEFDLSLLKNRGPVAIIISEFSILLPFLLGAMLALVTYPIFATSDVPFTGFALFLGASMSVTAFPVLARILSERGLLATRSGALALTCAAVNDVSAWCLLAFVIAIVRAGGVYDAVGTTVKAVVFVGVMLGVIRPFLARVGRRYATSDGLSQTAFAVIMFLLLGSALTAEAIGIHALFGAFLFGAVVPREGDAVGALIPKIEDLVVVVLLPIFFAITGLRTRIGLVDTPELWGWAAIVTTVATVGKFLGSAVPARLMGVSTRESATLGALMNTRGLMELIILNIGLDLGVLSPLLFSMMVMMAVTTTFITTPVVRLLFPPERVLAEREEARSGSLGGVLAAVSHPESVPGIARIVAALCAGSRAPAWALRLIPLADRASLFPEMERPEEPTEDDAARALALEARGLGASVEPLSFASADPAKSIVEVARLREAAVIVLGLHRPLLGTARFGGPVVQVAHASNRDVCMLHDQGLTSLRRVLLATGGAMDGPATRIAERLASAPGIELVRLSTVGSSDRVQSVLDAADEVDLVVVGAGAEWELPLNSIDVRTPRLFSELACSLLVVHGAADRPSA